MVPRRSSIQAAPHGAPSSGFDRLTFTACMLTIAVVAAVVTGYGPAAAFDHILEVLRTTAGSLDPSGDLYGTAMLPL